jgi:hypothetical protein
MNLWEEIRAALKDHWFIYVQTPCLSKKKSYRGTWLPAVHKQRPTRTQAGHFGGISYSEKFRNLLNRENLLS